MAIPPTVVPYLPELITHITAGGIAAERAGVPL